MWVLAAQTAVWVQTAQTAMGAQAAVGVREHLGSWNFVSLS